MALTYGFFNSKNGDRKYNANQMSSIFDGIIVDGVFGSIGTCFVVKEFQGIEVKVGIGKAWFNKTWTLNDSILPIEAPISDILHDRIDALVIEVNANEDTRANSIKFVQGVAGSNPQRPELQKTGNIWQYPICYISRKQGSTKINQADITNMVGTVECPMVTGILQTISLDELGLQWQAKLDEFITNETAEFDAWQQQEKSDYDDWFDAMKLSLQASKDDLDAWIAQNQNEFTDWMANQKTTYNQWFDALKQDLQAQQTAFDQWKEAEKNGFTSWRTEQERVYTDWFDKAKADLLLEKQAFDQWMSDRKTEFTDWRNNEEQLFDAWFADLQNKLDGDVAAKLTNEVSLLKQEDIKINERIDNIPKIPNDLAIETTPKLIENTVVENKAKLLNINNKVNNTDVKVGEIDNKITTLDNKIATVDVKIDTVDTVVDRIEKEVDDIHKEITDPGVQYIGGQVQALYDNMGKGDSLELAKAKGLFGGIEPDNLKEFGVKLKGGKYYVTARLPDNTVIEGKHLSTVAGCMIRYKLGKVPPMDIDDGELFKNITSDIIEEEIIGSTINPDLVYSWRAFVYNTQGTFNRSMINSIVSVTKTWHFGYDMNNDDMNPKTRISYPTDVDNANYTPFGKSGTTYTVGSWTDEPGKLFNPIPVAVDGDGLVKELNPNNYSELKNGGSVDDNDCIMVQFPKIYIKRWMEGNIYKFRCSSEKVDSDYECYSNYDRNGNEIDNFYMGAFSVNHSSSKGSICISGFRPANYKNINEFRSMIRQRGIDWDQLQYNDFLLINDLLFLITKDTNQQDWWGNGVTSYSQSVTAGKMNNKGLFFRNPNGSGANSGIKVFGMEDWWGNTFRFIDGIWMQNNIAYIRPCRSSKFGGSGTDYGQSPSMAAETIAALLTGGFIKSLKSTKYGVVPNEINASSTTGVCDYYEAGSATYATVGFVGGDESFGVHAGPWYMSFYREPTFNDDNVSCSISYKPTV